MRAEVLPADLLSYSVNHSSFLDRSSCRLLYLHASYCTCPRCRSQRRTRKLALAAGLPIAAIGVFFFFYADLSGAAPELTDARNTITETGAKFGESVQQAWTFDPEETKQLLHKYINEERENQGLNALEYDYDLAAVAQSHSEDMAKNHYFDHVNPKGEDPSDRAERLGYSCFKDYGAFYTDGIAENLVEGGSYYGDLSENAIAKSSVKSWMESPGHKANILTPTYDKGGFGIAEDTSQRGRLYITQNFC